ncbi:glycosyltransferase [Pseudomonas mendocina]|uniref:Glycosyltransferase n=1 Tax=Ectopseudomonas oleovorans TaxID=301 RepID=A0AB35KUX8_ECTOL|nr:MULTISPECIES: glycosyltransferase [Pseudomonas aeruginosa group]MCR1825337.1 glycosyltransferase [Pseudomonas oleovorans]MDG9977474.1 glycosyltransferase [Pseudomonas oleovorans]MDH0566252.1 glycosyltransferase [Pseudomonas oleovorans]MDV5862987.1 glycosyltransferase [Pseudomonas mendocina]
MAQGRLPATERGKVSVVIPSYNYARFLPRAIDSLRAQDFTNWEAIIVDDGSTDDTRGVAVELMKDDARIVYLHQENAGTSAAKNAGIQLARGEYLMFLDADDLLSAGKLTAHVQHLDQNTHVDISYSRFRYFRDGCEEQLFTRLDLSSVVEWSVVINGRYEATLPVFMRGNNMAIHAAMMRRSLVDRVGYFDTRLQALEDWDYWLRCALHGAYIAFMDAPQAIALTRVHKSSATHVVDFSAYKERVYENARQEALTLLENGQEQAYGLVMKEFERLKLRKRKRILREQRELLRRRIQSAGLMNLRELSSIAEQFGRVNCLRAYLGALAKFFFVWW